MNALEGYDTKGGCGGKRGEGGLRIGERGGKTYENPGFMGTCERESGQAEPRHCGSALTNRPEVNVLDRP